MNRTAQIDRLLDQAMPDLARRDRLRRTFAMWQRVKEALDACDEPTETTPSTLREHTGARGSKRRSGEG